VSLTCGLGAVIATDLAWGGFPGWDLWFAVGGALPLLVVIATTRGGHLGGAAAPLRILTLGPRRRDHRRIDATKAPHLALDEVRPGLSLGAKALTVFLNLVFAVAIALSQMVALAPHSLVPWWIGLVVVASGSVVIHRATAFTRLAFADEPFDEPRGFYFVRLRSGIAWSWRSPERVMVCLSGITVILDLIARGSDLIAIGTFAWFTLLASICAAAVGGLRFGGWYVKRIRERYGLLREYRVESISETVEEAHGIPILKADLASSFNDLASLQKLADSMGYTVTGYDLVGSHPTAELTPVTEIERKIYDDAARNVNRPVHEFKIGFEWVENDEEDRDEHPQRLEAVTFHRSPVIGLTPEKRLPYWQAMIGHMPKTSNGWTVTDDQDNRVKVLRYGKPLRLPDVFAGSATLPRSYSSMAENLNSREWARVPLGVSPRGRIVSLKLADVPHALYAGGTNSGKSTAILQDMLARRSRGHMLAVFDNSAKKGGDFLHLKHHTFMFCTSPTESANGLAMLYEEVRRRSRFLMERYRVNNWLMTDDYEGLIEAGVVPMTIYYDEYETSIEPEKEPKALSPSNPKRINAQKRNLAVDEIVGYMLKLGREARAVGIFLVVATQKPLQAKMGPLRDQLGNSMQLANGKMASSNVQLTMGSATDSAMELVREFHREQRDADGNVVLDDQGEPVYKRGLGIALTDGSEPVAIRVALTKPQEAPTMLSDMGVPDASPWELWDALDLDIESDTDRFIDAHDTRARIAPPFDAITHLGAAPAGSGSGTRDVAVVPSDEIVPGAAQACLNQPDQSSENAARARIREKYGKSR